MEIIKELEMLSEELILQSKLNLMLEKISWDDFMTIPDNNRYLQQYYIILLSNGKRKYIGGMVNAFSPNAKEALVKKLEPFEKRGKDYEVYFQGKVNKIKVPKKLEVKQPFENPTAKKSVNVPKTFGAI